MTEKKELRVHVTSTGGVYVDANELMRSDAARKAIEQAKKISQSIRELPRERSARQPDSEAPS